MQPAHLLLPFSVLFLFFFSSLLFSSRLLHPLNTIHCQLYTLGFRYAPENQPLPLILPRQAPPPDSYATIPVNMILQRTILAIYLSLALLFSSPATGAAIPPRSMRLHESEDTYLPPTTQAAITRLSKRTPSYFPETVPDAAEIEDRLTTLREAGLVPSSHPQQHEQFQAGTSSANAEIDTGARIHSSRVSHMGELVAPAPLPPLAFFVFASSLVCVATIIQKMRAR